MTRVLSCLFAVALVAVIGCGKRFTSEVAPDAAQDVGAERLRPMMEMESLMKVDAEMPQAEPAFAPAAGEGVGPGEGGEKYDRIVENAFQRVTDHPLSTFSIDVDTASYSKVRQYLFQYNRLPRPDAVRLEELLNYFPYDYQPPDAQQSEPFATHIAISECPWNPQHRLARVALQGRVIDNQARPSSNLVFLIDSSGSMNRPNKLPLLRRGLQMMLPQLGADDRVAIVVYAGSAGLVLDSTPATEQQTILSALNNLKAGGSTNGGEGLALAYAVARDHFIDGGTNRILLCTDGDFNVGMTGTDQMVRMVEEQSKGGIDLTVLGFGMGNLNDAMLEQISGNGNGNYAFIDTVNEARKVLIDQLSGTLVTIAKDVKIQIEFNPAKVSSYRLIGYENRMLKSEDFDDDNKDAGEIGAGHAVTALYEIVPSGAAAPADLAAVDSLKYQKPPEQSAAADSNELFTLKLRYKFPGQDNSQLLEHVAIDSGLTFEQADGEFQFAAAVAGFGMLLRDSEHRGDWTYDAVQEVAESAVGKDTYGFRKEFVELVAAANALDGVN
jgi:Ca-activated chloride channel family protein